MPQSERHYLEEMERVNGMIADIENAMHLHQNVKFLENRTLLLPCVGSIDTFAIRSRRTHVLTR